MKKRHFLKLSAAAIAGTAISPVINAQTKPRLRNWAGNLEYGTNNLEKPAVTAEVSSAILRNPKLRTLGTRHAFNTIADSRHLLLSTQSLDKIVGIDKTAGRVTVGAGLRYGQLAAYLQENGLALHNLASLPHISVGGAVATATHGSGVRNGNLSAPVTALEIVNGQGKVIRLERGRDEDFEGAVVGLGACGVMTNISLEIQPTFDVAQDVYLKLPMNQLYDHYNDIMSMGYSVSLFTDWQSDTINQWWIKRRISNDAARPPAERFGAHLADRNVHPIIELSAENCTDQMGVAGPWHERLPHFKMGFTPSSGDELQAEYFVPYDKGVEAIQAVYQLRDLIKPVILITEIRTIAADNFWMSPCYKRDSVAIHFTLKPDKAGVAKLLPRVEEKLMPLGVRPHWAKLFTLAPSYIQKQYEKLPDFVRLMKRMDPLGKFVNEFIDKNILSA